MKVVFQRDALVHATGVVQSLVNPQNTLPVLANVLIEAEGETVRFTASDLEGSASGVVTVSVPKKKKSVAVDGGELYDSTI